MDDKIRNKRFLSKNDTCRPISSGKMLTKDCEVERPLPCIVILVHGVNDVGESYQNQDEGICAGLSERLGRDDLHPHDWIKHKFMISDIVWGAPVETCTIEKQTCVGYVNRSPVIPFYWGYKPVDRATFQADQQRYREELKKKQQDADLPYDTFRQDDARIKQAHDNQNIDNLNNWLDPAAAKGGGTFANATTSIPDMFGPGANGVALDIIGKFSRSRMNDGDWSHPIYNNPHRIYQAYAARRLADLILAIRRNPDTETDTINIVAHSQGTLVTLLASMWVKAEGLQPADCVILNHSPYSLENRWLENAQPGNQQTRRARQTTLANFCKMMATNRHYNGGQPHDADYLNALDKSICLHRQNQWHNPAFSRNNFGMVYNYFCPNDQVVSMLPVQGFGWSGVPDGVRNLLGDNFRQRVFCRGEPVGEKTGYRFTLPLPASDDPKIPLQDARWAFDDITINAPLLPEPFVFTLMTHDGYRYPLSATDKLISRAAMKAERFIRETLPIPDSPLFADLRDGQSLTREQLADISARLPGNPDMVDGGVQGRPDSLPRTLLSVRRRMTDAELDKAVEVLSTYSQHSSIVCNTEVPRRVMAYDLAIGQNNAFEDKTFWDNLLLQADWRRPGNPEPKTKKYYQEGILPPDFKPMMNKPESGEKPMPGGEFGVLNDYGGTTTVKEPFRVPYGAKNIDFSQYEFTTTLQWPMPKPKPGV